MRATLVGPALFAILLASAACYGATEPDPPEFMDVMRAVFLEVADAASLDSRTPLADAKVEFEAIRGAVVTANAVVLSTDSDGMIRSEMYDGGWYAAVTASGEDGHRMCALVEESGNVAFDSKTKALFPNGEDLPAHTILCLPG